MILSGYTKDRDGKTLPGVLIEIKDEGFHTQYRTWSDAEGRYTLEAPAGTYPFLTAVRDYGESYLEYWGQNIPLTQDRELDIRIDTLEIYGLHVFAVKGAYPSLMVYFRPMSLQKFRCGDADICPDIQKLRVSVNDREVAVLMQNPIREFTGDGTLTACLLQIALPKETTWNRLDVELWDTHNAYGAATVFNTPGRY